MKIKEIALFGIFRSGTNFTRAVLEWNYDCRLSNNLLGWKHGFYPIIAGRSVLDYPQIASIFVTKNPFSSIDSLFRYFKQYHKNIVAEDDWKSFLTGRFVTFDSYQTGSPQYRFANVVDYWNSMNWNYSSVQKPGVTFVHVKYEDMLVDAPRTAEMVSDQLHLQRRFTTSDDFRIPSRMTKNLGDNPRRSEADYLTDRPFDKKRYVEARYYEAFDEQDFDFVLTNLDMDLVHRLGYGAEISAARELLTRFGKSKPQRT